MKRSEKAFTLTEVLMVFAILGVLLFLSLSGIQSLRRAGRDTACLSNIRNYGMAVLAFAGDRNGLPWWDGNYGQNAAPGSTDPNFELFVRPYLNYTRFSDRLRCPLEKDSLTINYSANYCGNAALMRYFHKLTGFPVESSRVVLAAECYLYDNWQFASQLNSTMWGVDDAIANSAGMGFEALVKVKNTGKRPHAIMHGPSGRPGMHLFFLDGHAALVSPTEGNWLKQPTMAHKDNPPGVGIFYDRGHFIDMTRGIQFQ